MSKVKVYNIAGKSVGEVDLKPEVFGLEANPDLIHQAVHVQRTNAMFPFAHAKTRSEVRGGGRKPWRQKGTGRARAGSSRSPLWIGGGVTFGPSKVQAENLKLNKKMKKKALLMCLSDRAAESQIMVVEGLGLEKGKTQELLKALESLKLTGKSVLIAVPKKTQELKKATGNIKNVDLIAADSLNVLDVIGHEVLLLDKESLPVIEKTYNPA